MCTNDDHFHHPTIKGNKFEGRTENLLGPDNNIEFLTAVAVLGISY